MHNSHQQPGLKFWRERAATSNARKRHSSRMMRGQAFSRTESHDPSQPYCDSPVVVGQRARASAFGPSIETSAFRPCRKCEKCRTFRRLQWRDRIAVEIAKAPRSWFVTLTFDPVHLAGVLIEARKLRQLRDISEDASVARAAWTHGDLYLKRLRKTTSLRMRYVAIFERGEETDRPHFHMCLHEVDGPITKRTIENQWRSNVHCRLVQGGSERAAGYLTKYLVKDATVRPYASQRYGSLPPPRA